MHKKPNILTKITIPQVDICTILLHCVTSAAQFYDLQFPSVHFSNLHYAEQMQQHTKENIKEMRLKCEIFISKKQ